MKRIATYMMIVVVLLPLLWACNDPIPCADCKMHRVVIHLNNTQPAPPLATRAIAEHWKRRGVSTVYSLYIFGSEGNFLKG